MLDFIERLSSEEYLKLSSDTERRKFRTMKNGDQFMKLVQSEEYQKLTELEKETLLILPEERRDQYIKIISSGDYKTAYPECEQLDEK